MILPSIHKGTYQRLSEEVSNVENTSTDSNSQINDDQDYTSSNNHINDLEQQQRTGLLQDQENTDSESFDLDIDEDAIDPPLDPPLYDNVEPMEIDESYMTADSMGNSNNGNGSNNYDSDDEDTKMDRFLSSLNDSVILPVRMRVMDPAVKLYFLLQEITDKYLGRLGNPIILKRFFYMIFMSIIAYYVVSRGYFPASHSNGFGSMFTNHDELIQYAKESLDLSKFERDLEYLSSMPHMSGTRGDTALLKYITESMDANNLKVIKDFRYMTYSNYPGDDNSTLQVCQSGESSCQDISLTKDNFNPLSPMGKFDNTNILYGHLGSKNELEQLKSAELLNDDFILLLKYDKFHSEQIFLAEEYGAKAILFMSDMDQSTGNGDLVQQKSVSLPQFGTGDILTPGYNGPLVEEINLDEAKNIAKIPVLPLSYNQGKLILDKLNNMKNVNKESPVVKFQDDNFSGVKSQIKINLFVNTTTKERQSVHDVIGKIEGKEQDDKAIIVAASRNSVHYGTQYPNFGTAMLLSLVQMCQEMKYKFDWKPLRNIYFISFGGNEFNNAGATELLEERLTALRDETYAFIDISQMGIWGSNDKKIDVQSHPLLFDLVKNIIPSHGFEINMESIQQYGDWIPFLANGIPTVIFANPDVKGKKLPIGTSLDTFESVKHEMRDLQKDDTLIEMLLYVFETILKLSDNPYIQFSITEMVNVMSQAVLQLDQETNKQLNCSKLISSLLIWKQIGVQWESWIRAWNHLVMVQDGIEPSLISVRRWTWNRKLTNIGHRQIDLNGIHDRSFYKNLILSPTKFSNGYENGHWYFPSVRDAMEEHNLSLAQEQINHIAVLLAKASEMFIEENDEYGNY